MIYCVRKPNIGVGPSNLFFDLSNPLDYNFCMLTTITELPEYIKRADSLLSESERKDVIDYLSEHPKAGDIMEGTGGIRKIRWSRANKGKSGGVRVIYYYHDERIPLYLLTMFGKNERANLSKADRNALGRLVGILITNALENNHG
jgi:mRNA-degrading endonuclease RelE of RelBE toxin-antitoxin system